MTDTYLELVNSGLPKTIAKRLGLPRPAKLRRYRPDAPLVPGPVLVLGTILDGEAPDPAADQVAALLLTWGLDVRRRAEAGQQLGAIVVVLTGATTPEQLSSPALQLGGVLRQLAPGGRVVLVSVAPEAPTYSGAPALEAATRAACQGMLRSVAKELRGGATANGIVLGDSVALAAPSVAGAVRFLLSGKSAYVAGQLIQISSDGGALPADWQQPLAGKVAVVTGAARGIGAAIAKTLARDGATVVAVDVPAAGEALAKVANDVRGTALQLDITADDAGTRLLEHALQRHGRLDIVVHNAGITRDKLLANMTADRWDPVLAVNLAAPARITEQLLQSGKLAADARIIALASTSGIAGNRGQTNYAASKAGVIALVAALSSDQRLAGSGGTACAVAPGFIETDMTARMPLATRQIARRLNSLQQGGLPIDVAEAVAFLASPQAGGISGSTLRVCGQNMVGA